MAEPASDYHKGEMDISEQTSTFEGFISLSKWGSLVIAAGLVFVTLVFCTQASLLQAGGAAVVLLVLGVLALREKKSAGH